MTIYEMYQLLVTLTLFSRSWGSKYMKIDILLLLVYIINQKVFDKSFSDFDIWIISPMFQVLVTVTSFCRSKGVEICENFIFDYLCA